MVLRATNRPFWFGSEHTRSSLIRHIGAHRVLKHNRIASHQFKRYELAVVELGRLSLRLDDKAVNVPAGQMLIIPPNTTIASTSDQEMNAGLFIWIGIDPEQGLGEMPTAFHDEVEALSRALERQAGSVIPVSRDWIHVSRAYFELIWADQANTLQRLGAAWQFAGRLYHELTTERPAQREIAATIAPALSLIEHRLAHPPTLDELAAACDLSRARFSQLFRESTGETPRDYINRRRVEQAKQLLKAGQLSITAIAHQLGFSSSQYFASVFRKFTDLSPSVYQDEHDV